MGKRHEEACHQRYMNGRYTHEKNVSTPHTREMRINTMLKYHYSPIRTAKINCDNLKWQPGCRETGSLTCCWWESKIVQPCWKQFEFLKKKERKKHALTIQPSNCTPGHFIPEK